MTIPDPDRSGQCTPATQWGPVCPELARAPWFAVRFDAQEWGLRRNIGDSGYAIVRAVTRTTCTPRALIGDHRWEGQPTGQVSAAIAEADAWIARRTRIAEPAPSSQLRADSPAACRAESDHGSDPRSSHGDGVLRVIRSPADRS